MEFFGLEIVDGIQVRPETFVNKTETFVDDNEFDMHLFMAEFIIGVVDHLKLNNSSAKPNMGLCNHRRRFHRMMMEAIDHFQRQENWKIVSALTRILRIPALAFNI